MSGQSYTDSSGHAPRPHRIHIHWRQTRRGKLRSRSRMLEARSVVVMRRMGVEGMAMCVLLCFAFVLKGTIHVRAAIN